MVSDDGPGADAIRVVPESWTVVERRSGQYRLSVGPLSERIVALTVGLAKTSKAPLRVPLSLVAPKANLP